MGIEFDVTEVLALADDLRAGAEGIAAKARPAVQDTAAKVKATMRADMAASGHFGQVAGAITHETRASAAGAEAEIGPTKSGAGPLANIAYFGGAHGGGGTVRDPLEAAEEHSSEFEQAIGDIVQDLL